MNETIKAKHLNEISSKSTPMPNATSVKNMVTLFIIANCPSPVRIAIVGETPTENFESDSEEIA